MNRRSRFLTGGVLAAAAAAIVFMAADPGGAMRAPLADRGATGPSAAPSDATLRQPAPSASIAATSPAPAADRRRPPKRREGYIAVAATRPAGNRDESTADLWEDQDRPLTYVNGAQLASGATIVDIRADAVVLKRGERSLVLPVGDAGAEALASAESSDRDLARTPLPADEAAAAGAAAEQGPAIVTVPQFDGTALRGVEVYPGADAELFLDVGLQVGDVITRIEGAALPDQLSAQERLQSLAAGDRLAVTLMREGRPREALLQRGPEPGS